MDNIINIADIRKDELVPVEEWDGECWKTMFNTLAAMTPETDPWETFANFMKAII